MHAHRDTNESSFIFSLPLPACTNPLSHCTQLLACLEMHTLLIIVCMKMTAVDGRKTPSLLQSNSIDSSDYFTPHSSCRSGELNCSRKSCPMTEPLTTVYVHCVHKYCNLKLHVFILLPPHRTKANMTFNGDFNMIMQADGGLERFKR